MTRYFFLIVFLLFSFNSFSNENLLTINQQLERLQREVSDLSKIVFSNNDNQSLNKNNDLVTNLSAIDIRIYDLEKDIKNLTSNLEEIFFQIDDLSEQIANFQNNIELLEKNFLKENQINQKIANDQIEDQNNNQENTLGTIKITSDNNSDEDISDDEITNKASDEDINKEKLSPEDEFQLAFDNIRSKNWENARTSFEKFIRNNPDNQLSGSAHYWLGELYLLEEKYRDAALVFAEGYQKFPKSLKAPDMLFKLSKSLFEVNKKNEACKTLEKLILDFPKNKFIKLANKNLQDYGCLENIE